VRADPRDAVVVELHPVPDANGVPVLVARVRGDLDVAHAQQARAQLYRLHPAGGLLVLDVTDVGRVDVQGLAVLVGLVRRLRCAGERCRLVVGDGPVAAAVGRQGLGEVLPCLRSLGEALAPPVAARP
jgi:anti-anti-sigma factor